MSVPKIEPRKTSNIISFDTALKISCGFKLVGGIGLIATTLTGKGFYSDNIARQSLAAISEIVRHELQMTIYNEGALVSVVGLLQYGVVGVSDANQTKRHVARTIALGDLAFIAGRLFHLTRGWDWTDRRTMEISFISLASLEFL